MKTCSYCHEAKPESDFHKGRGRCKPCRAELGRKRYAKKREHIREVQRKYYQANAESFSVRGAAWREANPERLKTLSREHYRRNRKAYRAADARRHAAKLERTPAWANLDAIREIYETCPPGYHVDHIIPLQGENVSGLHVVSNLRHLPASENIAKGNKFSVGLSDGS